MFAWLIPKSDSLRISRYLVMYLTSFECIFTFVWCITFIIEVWYRGFHNSGFSVSYDRTGGLNRPDYSAACPMTFEPPFRWYWATRNLMPRKALYMRRDMVSRTGFGKPCRRHWACLFAVKHISRRLMSRAPWNNISGSVSEWLTLSGIVAQSNADYSEQSTDKYV